jgi:ribosome-binding protein aMBF1 (putative translation factor)
MKARSESRLSRKTLAQRSLEQALRDKLQKEKPSLDDLIRSGECNPDAVMTMGMYFDVQTALQALKKDRKRIGLSVNDVAQRSGLDPAVVSRLETGKQDNPTIATLMRYAAALGKRFLWSYQDLATFGPNGDKKARQRRTNRAT